MAIYLLNLTHAPYSAIPTTFSSDISYPSDFYFNRKKWTQTNLHSHSMEVLLRVIRVFMMKMEIFYNHGVYAQIQLWIR